MDIGISTACFYPLETEKALRFLGEKGVATAEVFFNTSSELSHDFVGELCRIADAYGIKITSVHPFTSGMEGFFFFTGYDRRFQDYLDLYRRYFETAARLGAKIVILHGEKLGNGLSYEESADRFAKVAAAGEEFGVSLAQENVRAHSSADPAYLRALKKRMGEKMRFVLDFKQAVRAGVPLKEYIDAMGADICHLHISDSTPERDCLPPGMGTLDYANVKKQLLAAGVKENITAVEELYASGYSNFNELAEGARFAKRIL